MEGGQQTQSDLAALAKERVTIASVPERIAPCVYDPDFKPRVRSPFTHLLIEQQAFPNSHEVFIRIANRLDTMQAVQQQSQWRLEFEPKTQSVTLHSIKIRRGSLEIEHAAISRLQFLQRETGLDGCVVNGWVTLLLLLEDIRPGDILEYSYSILTQPRILPECFSCFFTLPPGVEIGKYRFSVHGTTQRSLRWKSSSDDLVPTTEASDTEGCLVWTGENVCTPQIEDYTPPWQLVFPWIQVSDFRDWQSVAQAVLSTWREDPVGEAFSQLVEDIQAAGPELKQQILRAIQIVQDGFRYLSVNLELGGTIPAPAETVARRRFGDCKDLGFLLVRLLRALGVDAAPVLVHTIWRESLSLMLPSSALFNHVVVEFHFEGERWWIDPTMKGQGGDLSNRFVSDFGLGLVLQMESMTLTPPPAKSMATGSFEVKECFILDTAGNPSYLAIHTVATGWEAENLRFEFENTSIETISKKRLEYCANRFSQASRIGELLYRDDRARNELVIAEAFEIQGFLHTENRETCTFSLQSDLMGGALAAPSGTSRRTPFAVPFPCNRVHIVEIDFAGLEPTTVQPTRIENDYFSFTRKGKGRPKFWSVVFTLNTLVDSVPPDQVKAYRENVQQLWGAISFQLRLPLGFSRMRKPSQFGMLPLPTEISNRPPVIRTPARPRISVPCAVSKPPIATESTTEVSAELPRISEQSNRDLSPRRQPLYSDDGRHSRRVSSSRRRVNRKAVASVYVLAGGILSFVIGGLASDSPGSKNLVGLLALVCIAAWPTSLALAFIGWRQCKNHPERYSRGKNFALFTLLIGGSFSLLLIPAVIIGVERAAARARPSNQVMADFRTDLKFDALKFHFHFPSPPWDQIDARMFGQGSVLAFGRPEPMFFTVCVNKVDTDSPGSLERLVELARNSIRNQAISYQLLTERELRYDGVPGWQTETRATFQGREYFLIHWYTTANGFGYQLAVWGAPGSEEKIREESERIFRNFELMSD